MENCFDPGKWGEQEVPQSSQSSAARNTQSPPFGSAQGRQKIQALAVSLWTLCVRSTLCSLWETKNSLSTYNPLALVRYMIIYFTVNVEVSR